MSHVDSLNRKLLIFNFEPRNPGIKCWCILTREKKLHLQGVFAVAKDGDVVANEVVVDATQMCARCICQRLELHLCRCSVVQLVVVAGFDVERVHAVQGVSQSVRASEQGRERKNWESDVKWVAWGWGVGGSTEFEAKIVTRI